MDQGRQLSGDAPPLFADYHDDALYYRTALNILTLMCAHALELVESSSARSELQYGV